MMEDPITCVSTILFMTGTVISIVCWAAFSPEMYLGHMTAEDSPEKHDWMLPEQFVEHLVTVAGGGEDALGTDPADRGVGAGLEILNPIYHYS